MNKILMILFVVSALCATAQGQMPITVVNPSFELPGSGTIITDWSQVDGWSCAASRNTGVEKNDLYSPAEGKWCAFHTGSESENKIYQLTGHTVTAGETYTLKVWARSINPVGEEDPTPIEARLYYGSTTINSVTQDVNPVRLLGDPRIYPNDDGGNVWLDQGYRMEFSDEIFYQLDTTDPLADPWTHFVDPEYGPGLAVGPIITPQGLKAVYSFTATEQGPPWNQEIWFRTVSGSPPDYTWSTATTVLSHYDPLIEANPWMIDPQLFYDGDTGKLWMSWGGGETLWVSEMDPTDGMLVNHPADTEFDTHPGGTHTTVALWDEEDWVEGQAMYKHNGYWYLFGSYGMLDVNYTIRMGRATSPTGPYYDKDGVDMKDWGTSMLLAGEGGQDCPGHPHLWEENGITYMGYDYIPEYGGGPSDVFGIRVLNWVNDWPTVYSPVEVTFNSDDYPDAIGQTLGISLVNTGARKTVAAFDYVSLSHEASGPADTDPPSPDPMTWASAPSAAGDSAIDMTATTASDPSGVEYYFDETSGNPGGTDSGWQDSTDYTDSGLNAATQYCYEVTARDKSVNQNETAPSPNQCATTDAPDTTPPMPDPATWASVPSADSGSAISMTATTATDPSGVSYFFDETSGNPGGSDSDWQSSPDYTDSGLDADTQYCYQVKARDNSANQNETGFSTNECATTQAGCGTTMHIDYVNCMTPNCGGGLKEMLVIVTIRDDCDFPGNPVAGADVTGTFTGDGSGTSTETTDSYGDAVFVAPEGCISKPSYTFTVDDVTHPTLTYNAAQNIIDSCSN